MVEPVFGVGFTYPVQGRSQRLGQGVAGAGVGGAQAGFKYSSKSNRSKKVVMLSWSKHLARFVERYVYFCAIT